MHWQVCTGMCIYTYLLLCIYIYIMWCLEFVTTGSSTLPFASVCACCICHVIYYL